MESDFKNGEELRKNNIGTKQYIEAVNTMIIAQHHYMMLPLLW